MIRMRKHSVTWLAPAILMIAGTTPLAAQLERPPTTTPTIYLAGPSWLSAEGYVPTKIMLKWKAVPNAYAYRIHRSSTYEPRRLLGEWLASAPNFTLEADYYFGPDVQVDMTSTYTYDIQAVYLDAAGSRLLSVLSPTASAKSPPFVAPSNFRYTAGLYQTPGKMRLTFTWDPVLNAQAYDVIFQANNGRALPIVSRTVKGTTLVVDDVNPKSMYTVCIITFYGPGIRDDTVRSCIAVKL